MKRTLHILLLFIFATMNVVAQNIMGVISDAEFGDPLPGVRVFYADGKGGVVLSNANGRYEIDARRGQLVFAMVGFDTQIVEVRKAQQLNVRMVPGVKSLSEVEVTARRNKYSRKNNPAVDMMRKVIDAKKSSDLRQHDYLSYTKYEKMTTALNEFTEKVFEDDHFKRMPFLKDHVERCPETGKLILPLIVEEKVNRQIYRRHPKSEKTIVVGERTEGVSNLLSTGELLGTVLNDCFQDVDIYDDDVRLFQYSFISPVSSKNAISFYRYFVTDTLLLDHQKCYRIDYTPNNPRDFGFSGSLYVLADSTWRLKRAVMNLPNKSGVNFVQALDLTQDFETLSTGEQVVVNNKMIVQLELVSWVQKLQVERVVSYSNFDFSSIPDRQFKIKGDTKVESASKLRDEAFWESHRPSPLTVGESQMDLFMKRLLAIRGVKPILWTVKTLLENHMETTVNGKSKFDLGPINTFVSYNDVEGVKLRLGGQTTAGLNPHWFGRGYAAYGLGDHRWKGLAELTYSINKKDFLPWEFPRNNIVVSYGYDVQTPSDKFVPSDRDNVFMSLKWTPADHQLYVERYKFLYDREWENGVHLQMQLRRERTEAAGKTMFQRLSDEASESRSDVWSPMSVDEARGMGNMVKYLRTTDVTLGLEYQPGASWVNTKERRLKTNFDNPVLGVTHTTGVKGLLGSDYNYNLTELNIYKRFWLHTWGKLDLCVKSQVQWNQVPYVLLPSAAANLSYIRHEYTYYLMANMEFMTDRNAQLMMSWDLNGKIFNRIPLLNRLKWREYVGCNMMWGYLSDKNNPYSARNVGNGKLYYFPGYGTGDGYRDITQPMEPRRPYTEVVVGVHNIFKVLNVECARRINYMREGTKKWGVRILLMATF